jgi:hypothetical protein
MSEQGSTHKFSAIDLLSQINWHICYMKELLTSMGLETEGGEERKNINTMGW